MHILSKLCLSTAMVISLTSISSCAQAGPGPDVKEDDVKRIIKEYLMENPEIVRDALIELERKQEAAAMAAVSDELRNDPRDIIIGPDNAKVTIIEFFDYNCGFCKRSTEWLRATMEKHPDDVRVIFKETPVLDGRSKTSRHAAKAALAAARQGKYSTVHFSLMNERGLTKERIRKIVEKAGLDMKKFDADMKDVQIEKHIEDTLQLARQIPALAGTPFFVINDEYLAGADTKRLQALLEQELKS